MGVWTPQPAATFGDDTFIGDSSDEQATGLGGADVLKGGGGDDHLIGGDGLGGDDAFVDILQGGAGDDTLSGWLTDRFIGGAGYDRAILVIPNSASSVLIDLRALDSSGNGTLADGTSFSGIEELWVDSLDETVILNIHGRESADTLFGGTNADVLRGNGGGDTLYGFDGADRLTGGAGRDYLYSAWDSAVDAESDLLNGGAGGDLLFGGAGDVFIGGAGIDYAYYTTQAGAPAAFVDLRVIDLSGNGVLSDGTSFSTVEIVAASAAWNSALQAEGHEGRNLLTGANLNDVLNGNGGDDQLNGFGGEDVLNGGAGDDFLNGQGAGADTASYQGAAAGVTIILAGSAPQDTIGAGVDTLREIENVTGSSFGDSLTGGFGNNGIIGGAGRDTLNGLTGRDTLTGGLNGDTFVFTAAGVDHADRITDFNRANDEIHLDQSVFSALTATGALPSAHFVTGPSAQDGDDYLIYNPANGNLFYDADGAGAGAKQLIATLTGPPALTSAEIIVI